RLAAELGALRDRTAQQIAGGNLHEPRVCLEPLRLRTLAGAGCAEHQDSHCVSPAAVPRSGALKLTTTSGRVKCTRACARVRAAPGAARRLLCLLRGVGSGESE